MTPEWEDAGVEAEITGPAVNRDRTLVLRRWMLACIIAVFIAVMVGGVTRLTESGLSITEWRPVSGVLPPLTESAWQNAYEEFRRIPQAQTVHRGITMSEFKFIFWWEWFHRILARGVGLVFAVPYLVLLLRGRIPSGLRARLAALPLLTLAQGVLGWYMVRSGLVERSSVSPYRLTAHLVLALAILAVAVWTYADLSSSAEKVRASRDWRRAVLGVSALVGLTIASGGFVAGLRAGRIFNTFPLMGGSVVPPGYGALSPWWVNALENPVAAQFHHRVLALVTGVLALALAWRARRADRTALSHDAASAVSLLGAAVLLQVAVGITTLLLAVPVELGVLHQFVGVLAFTAAVVSSHRVLVGADP